MKPLGFSIALVLALAGSSVALAQDATKVEAEGAAEAAWDARAAEHLLNRAGFGARRSEIETALRVDRATFVKRLVEGDIFMEEPFYERLRSTRSLGRFLKDLEPEARRVEVRRLRAEDKAQLEEFSVWWIERMLDGGDPLRERMTLFWHGYFTSSQQDVKNSHEMIVQNQLLRRNALGSFRELLHGVARDSAMLEYLDNADNRRESPNENFARELMELFTLGEGHYTEKDVKEAARAFTGWTDKFGRFRVAKNRHDDREKVVLGKTGNFDGADVLEILLGMDQCARHLAGRLITYFEGLEPSPARLERYAGLLRESGYALSPFLETLFNDPGFYRDAVVGTRISSPIDCLVGHARRLGSEPPARLLSMASAALGEQLFFPPNVKGWEGGRAWITTSSLMQRGNFAGAIVGEVRVADFLDYDPLDESAVEQPPMDEMDAMSADEPERKPRKRRPRLGALRELKELKRLRWKPRMNLVSRLLHYGARGDGEIVDAMLADLLAVDVGSETRRGWLVWFKNERRELGVKNGRFPAAVGAEDVLRRFAHLILCLPEAQLH